MLSAVSIFPAPRLPATQASTDCDEPERGARNRLKKDFTSSGSVTQALQDSAGRLEGGVAVFPLIVWRNHREHIPVLGNLAVFDSKKIVVRCGQFGACLNQAEHEISLAEQTAG